MVSVTGAVNKNHIIMDNGSGYLKMGFAGDQFPWCTIPTIVGFPELRSGQQVGEIQLKEFTPRGRAFWRPPATIRPATRGYRARRSAPGPVKAT